MWSIREPAGPDYGKLALIFGLGAAGGFAIGLLLSGREAVQGAVSNGQLGTRLRESARGMAQRLGPARLQRPAAEQDELTALEDAVLDEFLGDGILGERGIDVGAVSQGIIELSGTVETHDESELAVRTANRVPGVRTVVNRLEIKARDRHAEGVRRRFETEDDDVEELGEWEGRHVGMGRRRQGVSTDPDQRDDSRHIRELALEEADRDQWTEEQIAARRPKLASREGGVPGTDAPDFDSDELDNQDPHGQHASLTLDEQPQQFNTQARVGEGLPPGLELALEEANVPVKPHGREEE